MSGIGILGNAISGLQTSQAALRNITNNVANVNNPDYARRQVNVQSRVLGGTEITDISRIANEFLVRESYSAISNAKSAEIVANMHDRLQSVFGDPSSNNNIPSKINAMFADISEMQVDPTSAVRRGTSLNSIQQVLNELGNVASSIQQIRNDADRDIFGRVGIANDLLKNIRDLNIEIVSANTMGGDSNALIDQRQRSLNKLAEIMDIRISLQADGQAFVATTDGVFMVSTGLTQLQYAVGGTVGPDTVFPRITLHNIENFSGIVSAVGQPLETHIISGELRGLLEMRDITLPKIAEEVGELASNLSDELNAIHNNHSAVPAPNQLTGSNTGLLATDAHGFSGISNFSVVDASGQTVVRVQADFTNNQYRVNGGAPVAFGGATLGAAVASINAGLGASGSLTFTNGVMTLAATNPAHGVAMVQDSASPSARAGRGFAHFFGMNDLVRADAPSHYETGLTLGAAHGLVAGGTAQFKLVDSLGSVVRDFTFTVAGATVGDVVTQLNTNLAPFGSFALDAQGKLSFTRAPAYEGSTLFSVNDLTDRGGTGTSMSQLFGIGPGSRQKQATGMHVRNDITQNNTRLALARLNVTAPGTAALGVADDRGAIELHALEDKVTGFSAAGHLTALNATLSDYGGIFLSNSARLAAQAENFSVDRSGIYDEIQAQISAVSGVNLDEELANLIVYQNSYNAAARMIKAAEELFNTLLDAV